MATIEVSPIRPIERVSLPARLIDLRIPDAVLAPTTLSIPAVLVQGYHPYAEDGGIYLPGIERILRPELYPAWSSFVTVQSHFSLFPWLVAGLVRVSGLGLMTAIFLLHIFSVWLTLYAAWKLACLCFRTNRARCGAVTALALCLTMPIAGTSLLLMDPYLTARSFSTPLSLLALAGAVRIASALRARARIRKVDIGLCAGSLMLGAVIHPLMAAYAFACVVLLLCSAFAQIKWRVYSVLSLSGLAMVIAALIERAGTPRNSIYELVAQSRTYWFLASWHWYEQFGLIAPLAIVAALWFTKRSGRRVAQHALARMGIAAGITGIAVALLFARVSSPSYSVAMLQPLRIFQIIYMLMILAIGGVMGEWILRHKAWRWGAAFVLLGGAMAAVQWKTFPGSAHLEFPWSAPANAWEQSFLWIRSHTPEDAVFALDANYITLAGEDAQNFRAIAERSALPDYSKDGGIAAIAPDLARNWIYGEKIQHNLNSATDEQRDANLRSASVGWVVLARSTTTTFPCVYSNEAVKVCRVTAGQDLARGLTQDKPTAKPEEP